ncbi:cation channel sperm-associated auxiliary subunit beta-like [Diadema setosum]|uniref:cation channel sperm-associated auxiliary subunit beta-like n=1 Tax=Diadema setosum TaxID=31175 RepID=UPI003B3BCAF9
MARVDVVFIILVIFNISKSLSGVTISVGSRWDSNRNLNGILVVENASMVVFCQINHGSPTLDGIESSIALGNTLFFSGLLPSLTIYNSTWSETFTFTADSWKPYLGFWEMEIQSESFSPHGSVNTGEWYGVVEMDVNTGLLKKTVSIIDPLREPIRNVNLGPVVEWSQAPWTLESPINISFSQSPCSPDVVVMTTLSGASDGVYLGVSFEGLRDNSTSWYDLGALLCSNMPSDDCSVGQLVDFKLTSEYLILLTSEAVYSLKLEPDSFTQELIKRVDVQDVTGDTPLANCRLNYTPACNQEKLLDEVIFLSKQAQYPGTKPQVLAVSSFPFSAWYPLNLTDTVPLLGLHSPQSGRFLILAQQQHQYSATLYQKENLLSVPPAKIKPLFPPSSIPLDFEPHGACLETVGYHSYLYGNQIWRSYNGVIFLKLVSLPPSDYITVCATSTHHHTTIFLTLMGSIYIAKTAIPSRVVEAESPLSSHTPFVVFIDHLGDVVLGGINVERGVSPQTWTQVIDIEKSIADASHAVETPMTIQHLTARHLMVYPGEINSTGHRESSGSRDSAGEEEPLLSQTAVGQELNAIGMHMLITEIKSLMGGATVAMATSLEPSLLSNMQTPAVSRNVSDLWLQEAPCHHVLTPDPSVAQQPTKYMDIADVFYFHVSASYVGVDE